MVAVPPIFLESTRNHGMTDATRTELRLVPRSTQWGLDHETTYVGGIDRTAVTELKAGPTKLTYLPRREHAAMRDQISHEHGI